MSAGAGVCGRAVIEPYITVAWGDGELATSKVCRDS